MAISYEQRQEVIALLVGMFDAAPNAEILSAFVSRLEDGETVADIANDMDDHALFTGMYPNYLTNEEFATKFTTTLLDGNSSADGLADGIQAVQDLLDAGYTQGETAQIAANFLMGLDAADATWGDAAEAFRNKVDVATTLATTSDAYSTASFEALQEIISDVDATADSVSDAETLISLGVVSQDDFDFSLTVNQDDIEGTAGDDTISAWIFNNSNTAQSGDMIDGNGGDDTLVAEIGTSQGFAVSLKTTSVENAFFRAQAQDVNDGADNDIQDGGTDGIDKNSQVDAQDMNGTSAFWSLDSRANLVIEDVRNNSHETTLGWRQADAGDVNFEVYFDTPHITGPGATSSGSQLYIEIMDIQSMDDTSGASPLGGNIYNLLQFTVDGETVQVGDASTPAVTTTYDDLRAGIQALLDAAGLDITASVGSSFTVDSADSGNSWSGSQIILTANDDAVLGAGGWGTTGFTPADSNYHTAMSTVAPTVSTFLDEVNIIFDHVGRGSKAADFVAGNISQGTVSNSKGIQLFDIEVQRDSWVDTVRTTNNWLEEVEIENGTDYTGSLRIDDLNDVRRVDASSMVGAVTLDVDLSDDTIAKFLDLDDTAEDGAADNVTFTYTLGTNNDSLDLAISREVASHEDFAAIVSAGTGNDYVKTEFVNDGNTLDVNWLVDQQDLRNVTIATGSGDDTVWTKGAGNITIDTSTGDDVVYTDNSAAKATWVFNAANTDVSDLDGTVIGTAAGAALGLNIPYLLQGTTVNVTLSGANAGGGDASGAADSFAIGWESSIVIEEVTGDQRTINQAIKEAIITDTTLNALLSVADGPDNTLVITTKIDGSFVAGDLEVELVAPTAAYFSSASALSAVSDYNRDNLNNSTLADLTAAAAAALVGTDVTQFGTDHAEYAGTSVLGTTTDAFTITFGAGPEAGGDTTISFDGVTTPAIAAAQTAAQAATTFAGLYAAAEGTNYILLNDNAAGVLTFVPKVAGTAATAVTLSDADFTATVATATATLTGSQSTADSDNIINVGSGDDVLVLGTATTSGEIVVFTGTDNGDNSIVNFTSANDFLNFGSYLVDYQGNNGSTSDASRTLVDGDAGTGSLGVAAANTFESNSVTILTGFTFTTTDTFAGLNGSTLLAALNNSDADGYASYDENDDNIQNDVANLIGNDRNSIALVENTANAGEYKIFHVVTTEVDATPNTAAVSAVNLIGTYDFGDSITPSDANILG